MSKTKSPPAFNMGDAVRAKHGITDPDFPDIPFGGWSGEIIEIQDGSPRTYLIELNERTLRSIHPIYLTRCERDGLEADQVWLFEEDLEPDSGEPVPIEQPTNIVTRPLSMDNQDDRIRAVFGLTTDDLLPESEDDESVAVYYKFLAAQMSFPFEAEYSFESGPLESTTVPITVLGLLEPDDSQFCEYGLFCQIRRDGERIEMPLIDVEVDDRNPNQQLVADYSFWFVNH